MIKRSLILISIFLVVLFRPLCAQQYSRFNSFSYNVNEGLLQSTIHDMAFDKNNCWWLSYPNGLQRFDGKNFLFEPIQPGLPDNKFSRFFKCKDGSLLVSHLNGISRYDDKGNKFALIYAYKEICTTSSEFIGENDGVIYFYTEAAEIIGINAGSFKLQSIFKTGLPDYKKDFSYNPKLSDNIIGGKVAMIVNKRIYTWDLKKGELLFQSPVYPDISYFLLRQINEHEILFYTYNPKGTLQVINTVTSQKRQIHLDGEEQTEISRCVIFQWQNRMLLSINERVYETDTSFRHFKYEIVNYQNEPPAAGATIQDMLQDNFGNLFLRTVTGGIRKIIARNYPLNYYSTGSREKNFIIALLADRERNRVLAGAATTGILIFDTTRQLIKQIPIPSGTGKSLGPNTILKNEKGEYFIFAFRANAVWKLSGDLKTLTLLPFISHLQAGSTGVGYFCKLLYQDREKAVVLSETKIYRLDFNNSKVDVYPTANGYIMSGVYSKPYFVIHYNDELVFLDEKDFSTVKRIPFKNTGGIRCYLNDRKGKIYAGTNKGIFVTDTSGTILQQFNKETGLPDECIYAMAFDKEGHIWCSTNKGIFKMADGKVLQHLMKQDGLQENEFNTNVVAESADGELYFGGVNGFNSFFPSSIGDSKDSVRLLMTGVMVNNEKAIADTGDWNISSIRLPYNRNALSFDFTAMGNHNPDQYIYQYRMDGVDNQWLQNDNMQTVRYSLAPGKYTFKVYASRSFDKNAIPLKSIRIIIQPPFWKSWWFMILLAIGFIAFLTYGINQRNKRKYARRLQQLENERQIKLERERISKDLHDSLGAYANAVLYNIELLEKEKAEPKRNELIADLKFASKDIITSLRETVWAFKKEQYTADECLLRIRNFVLPLSRYYQQIHFIIEGEAPVDKILHYTRALNIVRIVQEAVTNSIKHSGASTIQIISAATADNKWDLTIQDNGAGFSVNELKESEKGNGLHNMEHRAAEAGFQFSVQSAPHNGTTINIMI